MESAENNPRNEPETPEARPMPDEIDWSRTTFEGNRLRQMQEFVALPFREKLERVEQMNELVEWFCRKNREKTKGQAQQDRSE